MLLVSEFRFWLYGCRNPCTITSAVFRDLAARQQDFSCGHAHFWHWLLRVGAISTVGMQTRNIFPLICGPCKLALPPFSASAGAASPDQGAGDNCKQPSHKISTRSKICLKSGRSCYVCTVYSIIVRCFFSVVTCYSAFIQHNWRVTVEECHYFALVHLTGKPHQIVVTSSANGHSAYRYILKWENPDTGGQSITEYEFHLRKVRFCYYLPRKLLNVTEFRY